MEKPAVEGMRFMPGELLFRIADLKLVWLLVDVFEQDLEGVKLGQTVAVHINAYPEQAFKGKVSFIYPTLTTETRTAKLRIELPNLNGLLKPGIYGSVELTAADGKAGRLAVPDSAILDSGTRQVVLVQLAAGRFEPRIVRLGRKADGYVEVLSGLSNGENVVTSANFLIDAESNLKGALDALEQPGGKPSTEAQPHQHGSH
jgi:Cu(I)/Ag(I) efflux system membrane fusion protein